MASKKVKAVKAPRKTRPYVKPLVWCQYDHCCQFEPQTHNARYCGEHKCKRKAENIRKRINDPENIESLWKLQEDRKVNTMITSQKKNQWLLDNSKFAFFDIETTNLDANIGMMICASIKDYKGGTKTFIMDREPDTGLLSDKNIALALREELAKYDYVVTYFGTRFDLPYLNTRLILQGERPVQQIRHIDMYYVARFKLKLYSNRLAVVTESLFGETEKTRVIGQTWNKALMGDPEALDYIVEHCEIDVSELEKVFEELRGFINLSAVRTRLFGGSY